MAKVAVKKRGRPAKKTAPVKKVATKRSRPRKDKITDKELAAEFTYNPIKQEWTRKPTLEDLNNIIAKLTLRVNSIEFKIFEAERAGAKIQSDLQKVRGKSTYNGWIPHDPDGSNGSVPIDARGKSVEVMRRDGVKCSEKPASLWTWYECGSSSIVAYRVIE